MSEQPQVKLPDMCQRHQAELVRAAKYKQSDAWRALIIVAQLALFQGATVTDSVYKKIEGQIERISELGCLACRLPHRWQKILRASRSREIGDIKALGESWVFAAKKPE